MCREKRCIFERLTDLELYALNELATITSGRCDYVQGGGGIGQKALI
jgi:hypothetical protein